MGGYIISRLEIRRWPLLPRGDAATVCGGGDHRLHLSRLPPPEVTGETFLPTKREISVGELVVVVVTGPEYNDVDR